MTSASSSIIQPGDLVGGRYRIESLLGQGGMATVYRARNTGTDGLLALKLIHAHLVERPELRDLFVKEARVGTKIGRNPYIVEVYDAGIDEARQVPFIAMELLDGEPLEDYLLSRGPLCWELFCVVMEQLGEALGQAHAAGVIHRDLKPANLFLSRDYKGRPVLKVLDFGIAKVLENESQRTATQIGTPAYAAPEQLGPSWRAIVAKHGVSIAQQVSPATDVWALGLIAYDLLTASDASQYWHVETTAELPAKVILQEALAPSERAGDKASRLPQGFDSWFAKCLQRDAAQRWQSAEDAVHALLALEAPKAQAETTQLASPLRTALMTEAQGPASAQADKTELAAPRTELASPPAERVDRTAFVAPLSEALKTDPKAEAIGRTELAPSASLQGAQRTVLAQPPRPVMTTGEPVTRPQAGASKADSKPIPKALWLAAAGVIVLGTAAKVMGVLGSSEGEQDPDKAEMVAIGAGTFEMGSNDGPPSEKPVHSVSVSAFWLDSTEVTVAAYRACVSAKACEKPAAEGECNWEKPGRELHPINCVSWKQASDYCKWADKRLPTEEEWEYAARGAEGRTYPWGNTPPERQLCWGLSSSCEVGSHVEGSALGLKDMAGNVSEWTASHYSPHYNDPPSEEYVVRGGSWLSTNPFRLRAANRDFNTARSQLAFVGFRCAR